MRGNPETLPLCKPGKGDAEWTWQAYVRHSASQVGVVSLFVVLGAGQALAASASVGLNGQFPYDTAAAVSCAEALKLFVAVASLCTCHRGAFQWPLPRAWLLESRDLFAVAVLFALQNELSFLIIERLGAALFMILGNLKIVFTCLFMRVMLGKRFAVLQWVGVLLLTGSAVFVKMPLVLALIEEDTSASSQSSSLFGIALLLVSAASSGLASVKNELILKQGAAEGVEPMPFMAKNMVLYLFGLALNLTSWAIWGRHPFLSCLTGIGSVSILCLAGMGLACAVILRYLDNVARCFGSVIQVLMTVVVSRLLPTRLQQGSFDAWYVSSLVLLAVSLVIYQAHDSPQLLSYVFVAVAGALSAGYLCSLADHAVA